MHIIIREKTQVRNRIKRMLTPTMHLLFAAAALVLLLLVPFSSAGSGHPSLHGMKKFKQDWSSYHSTMTRRRIPTTTTTSFATGTATGTATAAAATTTTTTTTSKSTTKKKKFQKQQLQIPRAGGTAATVGVMKPLSYYLRVAFAGGVAGATGTAVLYPMDSAKTLRQSNPNVYKSVQQALMQLIRSPIVVNNNNNNINNNKLFQWHISHAYKGIVPAALGAIPSSALYFGAYESSKIALSGLLLNNNKSKSNTKSSSVNNNIQRRLLVHGLAAASGNTVSSAIFVPKEVIKQRLQQHAAATTTNTAAGAATSTSSIVMKLIQEKGIRGLYAGYQATLMRNIPSAILRFVLYEELKRKWGGGSDDATTTIATDAASTTTDSSSSSILPLPLLLPPKPIRLFAAGAVAGAISSGFMTPIDVIKTRMATGTCPLNVRSCFLHVIKEAGWNGLYAGAGSRMMWSGAFSAIGFGTFEFVKQSLGVASSSSS